MDAREAVAREVRAIIARAVHESEVRDVCPLINEARMLLGRVDGLSFEAIGIQPLTINELMRKGYLSEASIMIAHARAAIREGEDVTATVRSIEICLELASAIPENISSSAEELASLLWRSRHAKNH